MYQRLDNFYQHMYTDSKKYPCTSLAVTSNFYPYKEEIPFKSKETFQQPQPPINNFTSLKTESPSCNFKPLDIENDKFKNFKESTKLLPVLDSKFNLREICKQSILLEDHLTHREKRCKDCCIKHFLALEGLCEEAVTLDKNRDIIKEDLPNLIRTIQKKWYENPDENAHECAQMLRQMRKKFQLDCFDIIFTNSCSSGVCSI